MAPSQPPIADRGGGELDVTGRLRGLFGAQVKTNWNEMESSQKASRQSNFPSHPTLTPFGRAPLFVWTQCSPKRGRDVFFLLFCFCCLHSIGLNRLCSFVFFYHFLSICFS